MTISAPHPPGLSDLAAERETRDALTKAPSLIASLELDGSWKSNDEGDTDYPCMPNPAERTGLAPTVEGYTLIELFGILAALLVLASIAIPIFSNFTSQARLASVNKAKGSLNSVSAMSKADYLTTSEAPATMTAEGVNITYSTAFASGHPHVDLHLTASGATLTVSPNSAATPATCSVAYTEPASAPTLAVNTTGW